MADITETVGEGLKQSFLMAYEVWWALVLGFAISGVVQAWVPRQRIENALAGSGPGPLAKATGLGAASSSCSASRILPIPGGFFALMPVVYACQANPGPGKPTP